MHIVKIAEELVKIAEKLTLEEQIKVKEEYRGEGFVYLIHFDAPYKHAQHYIGWATDVEQRVLCHKKGTGARLLQVLNENGLNWQLVRVWEGVSRDFERKLKSMKNSWRYCPICNPNLSYKLEEAKRFCNL
jgi:predicted GIY-YIG superfamily endonuclease